MKPLRSPTLANELYQTSTSRQKDGGRQNDLATRLELLEARLREPAVPHDQNANHNSHILESPAISQHSFKFDTPSRHSRSNISLQSTSALEQKQAVSSSGRSGTTSSTLEVVNQAAEMHIRKVAAQEESLSAGHFPLAAHEGHSSLSNASHQTILTSHTGRASSSSIAGKTSHEDVIIKESPPPPSVQPSAINRDKLDQRHSLTGVDRNTKPRILAVTTDNVVNTSSSTKRSATTKRKSTPVKRDASSANRQRKSSNTNSNAATTHNNNNQNNIAASDGTRKRTRLQFSGHHHDPSLSDANVAHTRTSSPLPKNSDSRSNPSIKASGGAIAATNAMKANNHKAPKNNKLIRDFFSAIHTNEKQKGTNKQGGVAESLTATAMETPHTPSKAPTKSDASQILRGTPSPRSEIANLQRKCVQLELVCQEKENLLKAVSNNKTILQTAVQSALKQRTEELTKVKNSLASYSTKVHGVVEQLMREQALQEALRLREQLAAEGTRLGRIVYTRAGMRSMESWEEGTASRQLQERRDKLLKEFQVLQEREERAKTAVQAFDKLQQCATLNNEKGSEEIVVEGIHLKSKLDALEATESVRLHLDNVQVKLKQLEVEVKQLQEHKISHIRSLKRVTSEDSSRFRHRPKVSYENIREEDFRLFVNTHAAPYSPPITQLHNRYVLMALLGKGGFSEVWRAFDVEDLQEVAVKIHQLDPRWSDDKKENYTKHVSREYEIHRNVRHPRIVSLLDVFEIDTNAFATVLECCSGTDLETILKQKTRLPERDARAILLQLLSGMNYLSHPSSDGSRQGIIHYDLKYVVGLCKLFVYSLGESFLFRLHYCLFLAVIRPGNILFDERGDAKITDFGLSKIVDAHDPGESMELTSQGAGTYWYLPPECFVMDEDVPVRISNKVDVWSIGVIFFQMLYGRRPFGHGQSQDRILTDHTMLNAKEVMFPAEPHVSEPGKQFIRDCLQYDQALRPTISKLCENAYVTTPSLFPTSPTS